MVLDIPTTKEIAIACDPGHKSDRFGVLIGYIKAIRTAHGIEEHLFVGSVLDWAPSEKLKVEVDFRNVLECLQRFSRHWKVTKVVYDQWNSVFQIQQLQAEGIDAEKIPLKSEDWDALSTLMYTRKIHLLHPLVGGKSAERLIWELKNLQQKGDKVDHSLMSSSDLAVCLCRLAKVLVSPEHGEMRVMDARAMSSGRIIHFGRP